MKPLLQVITYYLCIAIVGISQSYAQRYDPNYMLPVGIGVASPTMSTGEPLFLYPAPDFDALPDPSKAIDSVTFKKSEHYIDIASAPPWLAPEHIKLDYQIFNFRVITYAQNWVEVMVNNATGQTSWVDRQAIGYKDWGTFLTEVVAVEIIDINKNPIRTKPLDNASILAQVPGAQLRPIAVKGDWLLVSTVGLADRIVPTGWIRWKKDNVMLITYSLLS